MARRAPTLRDERAALGVARRKREGCEYCGPAGESRCERQASKLHVSSQCRFLGACELDSIRIKAQARPGRYAVSWRKLASGRRARPDPTRHFCNSYVIGLQQLNRLAACPTLTLD
jgi:hypothetical protein